MWWRIAHFAAGLFGTFLGYVAWVIARNWEDVSFYTIRSAATGATADVDIHHHPLDNFVWQVLLWTPLMIGAVGGLLGFGLIRHMATRRPE